MAQIQLPRSNELKEEELPNGIELIKDRLYFATLRVQPRAYQIAHFFTVDNDLVYESFFADFGPLNLGHVYAFCNLLDKKLEDPKLARKKLFIYTSYDACKRTNAAFLVGAFMVIRQNKTPEEAFRPFESMQSSFLPFRDASVGLSTYNVHILDCLKSLYKAIQNSFFDYQSFNLEEYQFYEKVENGDFNWIVPGKFLAFSGPSSVFTAVETGQKVFTPEDYIPLFKKMGITTIVRLNKKEYDRSSFVQEGIKHYDLYFMDGSAPSESILRRFLEIAESEPGVIAVHCKAGLGRTGTLIAAYIIKHFRFTAAESIAWVRICRPGSVIGPQQHFLQELQSRLWKQGETLKKKKSSTTSKVNNSAEDITESLRTMTVATSSSTNGNLVSSLANNVLSSQPTHNYQLRERAPTKTTGFTFASLSVKNTSSSYQLSKYGAKASSLKRTKSSGSTGIRTVSATISTTSKSGQRSVNLYTTTRGGTKRTLLSGSTAPNLLLDKRK